MELRIDGVRCDTEGVGIVIPAFDLAVLADPAKCRSGRSLKLEIPVTDTNAAVLKHCDGMFCGEKFNGTLHRAEVVCEGVVLFEGAVRMLSRTAERFTLEIAEGGAPWAESAALTDIAESGVGFSEVLTPAAVCESWSGERAVRFLPLSRDAYPELRSSTDLLPDQRLLSVDDYHPFLHVATLVSKIFEKAGYEVRSDFFDSEFFRSLHISGAYSRRDVSALEARMGFCAGRTTEVTAEANAAGRVYADPSALYNSVGDIVQSAAQDTVNDDGVKVEGLHNNGGCFAVKSGRISYTPLASADVGFDYRLRYTTDHRILSRGQLTGFDTFYLGAGSRISYRLVNRYEDRRGEIAANRTYRAIVFDHEEGSTYRLTYTKDGVAGSYWAGFSARSAAVTTPAAGVFDNPVLMLLESGAWVPYEGDWALYDGYIGETGQTTVDVRLRSAAEPLTAGVPKYFDRIFFEGAEEGMALTLHGECSLRPHFQMSPGVGSAVEFPDVAKVGFSQMELLEALAHLFNLRFVTDKALRRVRIEPAEEMFSAAEVDWSSRTDFSQEVVIGERCAEQQQKRSWGYMAGDGAVTRFERSEGGKFGRHTYTAGGCGSRQGEERNTNPLFAPTINLENPDVAAPSALVPRFGDRDDLVSGELLTPRIVSYAGLHPLPDGERWPSPSAGDSYPLAAFHFEGDEAVAGFTLCFEDRDGVEGLHRYHDAEVARGFSRESITLTLCLAPDEYAALFIPEAAMAELRSTFRIDTGRGVVRARLAEIGAYDADRGRVRCRFDRLIED